MVRLAWEDFALRNAARPVYVFRWSSGGVTLDSCTFIGNSATHAGGGMHSGAYTATLSNCIFTG